METMETDSEGYLKNSKLWNIELAKIIAKNEGIECSPDHWEIIYFMRNFYLEFNILPTNRILLKAMNSKLGTTKSNSRYLYKLFPNGLMKQATKIAGLPKSLICI